MPRYDRLTGLDSSFLHLERLETPMHVGAVTVLEGAPFFDDSGRFRLADVRRLVSSRLHLIPRFRRRLMRVPFEQGRPIWVDDERFDIAYHVRLTALPAPGSREQLMALAARLLAGLLDRSRPLWELWFIEGLAENQVALIQKTHHALVDGVSGVDVATVLLDFTPEPTFLDPPRWVVEPPPSPGRLLADSLYERATEPAEMLRTVRHAARAPQHALERTGQLGRAFATLADKRTIAPRTSLNAPVGRSRRFEGVRISLDDVKTIRMAFGGTINDVVLAGVTGALRRLLESRSEDVTDLSLRALCPVSVRDTSEQMQLGNKISAMFVDLPVGLPDPGERLAAIQATTKDLKDREQALGAAFLLDLTHYAAPTLVGLAARLVARQPFVNVVVTNVPGPQTPLYCMGARMYEAYPIVPLAPNLGIGIAILSYCGRLHFGLFADADAHPDIQVLAAGVEESFAELKKLADEVLDAPTHPTEGNRRGGSVGT
ncbi:MAG TPA: wax ester/triacylglycerol synthase family O-acyltransferase [Acidimicrobiia bacterium]|jgi:WS/DGAT/MGAT family acyltransferase